VQLASGVSFTCGITLMQTVRCWGEIKILEVPGLYTQITASELYACGVKTDGTLLCWGHAHAMRSIPQVSNGDVDPRSPYRSMKFVQISCSPHHCCALDTNGQLSSLWL
jgi:hypothetical protein